MKICTGLLLIAAVTVGACSSAERREQIANWQSAATANPGATLWQSPGRVAQFPNGDVGIYNLTSTTFAWLDKATGAPEWTYTPIDLLADWVCPTSGGTVVLIEGRDFVAHSVAQGTVQWTSPMTSAVNPLQRPTCLARHGVILDGPPSDSTIIQGIDAATGLRLWSIPLRRWDYRVIEDGNRVYLAVGDTATAGDGSMVLLDPRTGAFVNYACRAYVPILAENGRVLCRHSGGLSRLDDATGQVLWTVGTGEDMPFARVSPSGDIFIFSHEYSSTQTFLRRLDPITGQTLWTIPAPGSITQFVGDNDVLVGPGGRVSLVSGSGQVLWTLAAEQAEVVEGGIYLLDKVAGIITRVRQNTGATQWSLETGTRLAGIVGAKDRELYLGVGTGGAQGLIVVDADTGATLWQTARTFALENELQGLIAGLAFDNISAYLQILRNVTAIQRAVPVGPHVVDSQTGFSSQQGGGGWSYGQYTAVGNTTFAATMSWTGSSWLGSDVYGTPALWGNGQHPGCGSNGSNGQPTVRRWTATYTSAVVVSGTVRKQDTSCGDGTLNKLLRNGTVRYTWDLAGDNGTGSSYSVYLSLNAGDTLDLVTYPKGDCYCDATEFTATITPVKAPVVNGSWYKIKARHSQKLVSVAGSGNYNGATVWQWYDDGTTGQKWQAMDVGEGRWKFVSLSGMSNNEVLDVSGVSSADGAPIQTWSDFGPNQLNQMWTLEPVDNGYYKVRAEHSGKLLDVSGVSYDDEAILHQWTEVAGNPGNQQFAFVPTTP